jgi:hypothetical protein
MKIDFIFLVNDAVCMMIMTTLRVFEIFQQIIF